MASVSATSVSLQPSFKLSSQVSSRISGLRAVSVGWTTRRFPSLRSSRFRICAVQAQPETMEKVCKIVRKQLALAPESELTPETKFSALGADSLDTVEIVMGLEEEFGINVTDDGAENITTVQEAADLIEGLIQKKD
ncbi:acyl carrier protein 1, chloroplastic-like [Lotus japonicus]|uniref:Acyl carrier protein n=1 Tax=Lotus japonicus TaxID=34305 RepID=I3T1G9_LOTJA|nr:acyl carrier protein 1, chloroplastic-like [Lotus japonicus]AFK46361.1 unknown [Lotus japonicus]